MENDKLSDYVFWYNCYTNQWTAAKREHYKELFNGGDNVIRSSSHDTLVKLITKYGSVKSINNNVR